MKSRYSLKRHLSKKVFVYVFITVLCPVFVTFSIALKNKPKDFEKISLFIIGDADAAKIESRIELLLPDVLETQVRVYSENEELLTKLYDTEGLTSDLVIMPKAFFSSFTRFPYIDFKNTYLSNENNFIFYDFEFGLKCNGSYFSDYIGYGAEDYYAFIKDSSVHTSEITSGKTNYLKLILEEFKDEKTN